MSEAIRFERLDDILIVRLPEEYALQCAAQQIIGKVQSLKLSGEIGILMDLTAANIARDLDSVRAAFAHWQPLQDCVARFAVLVKTDLHWGLTRQVSVFAEFEGFSIRPFRDQAEAIVWLSQAGVAKQFELGPTI